MLFIIKPTAACNGACIYCSAYKHHPDELKKMTPEEVTTLLLKIEEYIVEEKPRRAAILWHGGEPMVMGMDFYEKVLEVCAGIEERTGVKLQHMMQSNITLVTPEFAKLLKRLLSKGRIGSSYDPIKNIRMLKGEGSYEEEWKRGKEILEAEGVGVGVVYVVHRESLGRAEEIYQGLLDLGLNGGVRFNPLYSAGLARDNRDLHITPREWGQFLLDLWEVWNKEGRSLRVDPLKSWHNMAQGGSVRITCAFSGRCTYNFTGIKADGTVYSCGRSMDEGLMPFGNLFEKPLVEILRGEKRRVYLNRKEWLLQGECAGCRWWSFCHGGCPNDAYLESGDMLRKTYWCEGRKLFLDEVFGKQGPLAPAPEPGDSGMLFDEPEPMQEPGAKTQARPRRRRRHRRSAGQETRSAGQVAEGKPASGKSPKKDTEKS